MKPTEEKIETILRHAPPPVPPPGLRDRLIEDSQETRRSRAGASVLPPAGSWWRRWWPAAAAGSVACLGGAWLTVQNIQIQNLRVEIQNLKAELLTPQPIPSAAEPPVAQVPQADGAVELEQLRETTRSLNAELAALQAMQLENQQLRTQEAAQSGLTLQEMAGVEEAREKAWRIRCINNLKQLGLAARIWATDHGDVLPPDFLSMSNELGSATLLICPKDEGRQTAPDWNSFSAAQASYQFVAPGAPEFEPTRVMFLCPIHNQVTLCDGSVQQLSLAPGAPQLIHREGKVYLDTPGAAVGTAPPVGMDPRMMERYGLKPDPGAATQPGQMNPEMMRRYGLTPAPAPEESETSADPRP